MNICFLTRPGSVSNPIVANMWSCMRGCACMHVISDKWSNLSLFSQCSADIPPEVLRQREAKWLDMLNSWDKWMAKKHKKVGLWQTDLFIHRFLFFSWINSLANALMFIKRSTAWCYLRNLTAHLTSRASKFTNCSIESDKVMTRPTQNIRLQNSLLYHLYWPLATHVL